MSKQILLTRPRAIANVKEYYTKYFSDRDDYNGVQELSLENKVANNMFLFIMIHFKPRCDL